MSASPNGFEKDPQRASEAGKKSKRKSLDTQIREYLEGIEDNEDRNTTLRKILFKLAKDGKIEAIKELYDRSYGKPKQPISGVVNEPVELVITKRIIDGNKPTD